MSISLNVEAQQVPLGWASFVSSKLGFSIALDGYVYGSPKFLETEHGPYANFNHHEEVDRLATRATCGQVLLAVRQGFFDTFRDNAGIRANVYVNDCDEDVCLSWFLLKNHFMVANTINPLINRLVDLEDKLDSTGGAYPISCDLPVLQEMAWVFDPYRRLRLTGGLDRKDSQEFAQVIQDVEFRIMAHITGRGSYINLDTRYTELNRGRTWVMVREEGPHARNAMIANGIKAFITARERKDGSSWVYTVGKISQFVNFDVPKILTVLNIAEMNKRGVDSLEGDIWGGGNTIGGSPRLTGSVLTPAEVSDIIRSATGETK